jgi:hypothetical protein
MVSTGGKYTFRVLSLLNIGSILKYVNMFLVNLSGNKSSYTELQSRYNAKSERKSIDASKEHHWTLIYIGTSHSVSCIFEKSPPSLKSSSNLITKSSASRPS